MTPYIGTKMLLATPMTRGDYNAHRGWTPPEGEDQSVGGHLVQYEDGYQSWSPDAAFVAYQPLDAMSFGHALVMLKQGKKVARAGWNGKGMWLILVPGTAQVEPRAGSAYALAGIEVCDILPHIDMWTTNAGGRRAMLPGWLASQSDMLADDWTIIE